MRVPIVSLTLLAGACSALPEAEEPDGAGVLETGAPLSPAAAVYDVRAYDIAIEFMPAQKAVAGVVKIDAEVSEPSVRLDFNLDDRLDVRSATVNAAPWLVSRADGLLSLTSRSGAPAEGRIEIEIAYEGQPRSAPRPPWDGGVTWSSTPDGTPWIATSVQGQGCDLWWPCKDHFIDKPDSVSIAITAPADLVAVSNGVLVDRSIEGDKATTRWRSRYPLSAYNVAVAIGPFEEIEDAFVSSTGTRVPISMWALDGNAEKARGLVDDLKRQLAYFEGRLGPYPWPEEKIGVVETPFLGMEHQTINAYGAGYEIGPHGFDWLLHHELAHEWLGNAMTHARRADFWLHEGTALYMQADYATEVVGDFAYDHYMYDYYTRMNNCAPIVPHTDDGSAFDNSDVYFKGAWVLHALRGLVGDDAFWTSMRDLVGRDPGRTYRTTEEFEEIVERNSGATLDWFFDAYLTTSVPPVLTIEDGAAGERVVSWRTETGEPFPYPVPIEVDGDRQLLRMKGGRGVIRAGADSVVRLDPEGRTFRALPIIPPCGGA